jgi:PilZ domain
MLTGVSDMEEPKRLEPAGGTEIGATQIAPAAAQQDSYLAMLAPVQRRRYPRVRCFLAVQLQPIDDQSPLMAKLSDVSLGGCGLESPAALKVGSGVAICPLATDGALWVQGVVVYTGLLEGGGGYCIGIRFRDEQVPPTLAHDVREFVRFVEGTVVNDEPQDLYLRRLADPNS